MLKKIRNVRRNQKVKEFFMNDSNRFNIILNFQQKKKETSLHIH